MAGAKITHRGPRRAAQYFSEVVWAATVDLWRSIQFLWGLGLVGLVAVILSGGVTLAAIFNIAWFFAAAFALLFAMVLVGGFRVWSRLESAYLKATVDLEASTSTQPAVPKKHRLELQALARGLADDVNMKIKVRYKPPPIPRDRLRWFREPSADPKPLAGPDTPVAQAFRAYFPDVAGLLDEWDELFFGPVFDALEHWVLSEATMATFGSVFHALEDEEKARSKMRAPGDPPIFLGEGYERFSRLVAEAVCSGTTTTASGRGREKLATGRGWIWREVPDGDLYVGSVRFAKVSPADDVEALKKSFDDLLAAARNSDEGGALRAQCNRQDGVSRELRDQLSRISASHVIRGQCDLCSGTA